jgi:hypothetical protein
LLQKGCQLIQPLGPEPLIFVQPFRGLAHRRGVEPACDGPAGLAAADQSGTGQDVDVLHHRRQRHGEWFGQFADGKAVMLAQAGDQGPAGRVGEGGEDAIEIGMMVNHVVKYSGKARLVKPPRSVR